MKVVVAHNRHRGHGGGGDTYAVDIAETLRSRGHDVQVFSRSSDSLPPGIRGKIAAASHILAAPDSVREFSRLLDAFRPDIVHVLEMFPLVSPYILPVCAARRLAVVLSPIDYRITCPAVTHLYNGQICTRCCGGREYWAVLRNCRGSLPESVSVAAFNTIVRKRRLLEAVSHYCVPSEFTRNFLHRQLAIPLERMSVLPGMVNTHLEEEFDCRSGEYAGFAGRFTYEKGTGLFLQAALLANVPALLARNVHSRREVNVPGSMEVVTATPADLLAFYRRARMIVVPSLWYETFGLVAAEAMAHALPVIVPRHGALGELVEDGVTGLHFTPGDAASLAGKMRLLWDDPELARRIGCAARQKASRLWTHDVFYSRLMIGYASAQSAAQSQVQSPK